MTIEEFYQKMNGSYAEVSERIPGEGMILKFVGKFPNDKSYETLCEQMQKGNREEAFYAAHTLKGLCANLGLGSLQNSAEKLTDLLRAETEEILEEAIELLEDVKRDYAETIEAINMLIHV